MPLRMHVYVLQQLAFKYPKNGIQQINEFYIFVVSSNFHCCVSYIDFFVSLGVIKFCVYCVLIIVI